MCVETWKRVTQSQTKAYIFLIKGKNLMAGSQQWGSAYFFHGLSIFSYNYSIVPNFQMINLLVIRDCHLVQSEDLSKHLNLFISGKKS